MSINFNQEGPQPFRRTGRHWILITVIILVALAGVSVFYRLMSGPDLTPAEEGLLADYRVTVMSQDDEAMLAQANTICNQLEPLADGGHDAAYNFAYMDIASIMAGPATVDPSWTTRYEQAEGFIDAAVDHLCWTRHSQ
jgi:hypothetical protein